KRYPAGTSTSTNVLLTEAGIKRCFNGLPYRCEFPQITIVCQPIRGHSVRVLLEPAARREPDRDQRRALRGSEARDCVTSFFGRENIALADKLQTIGRSRPRGVAGNRPTTRLRSRLMSTHCGRSLRNHPLDEVPLLVGVNPSHEFPCIFPLDLT